MFTPARPRSSPMTARAPGWSSVTTTISSSIAPSVPSGVRPRTSFVVASVRAFARHDRAEGAPQDPQVERQRPVLDVEEVVTHVVGEARLRASAHLPQARHAGFDLEAVADPVVVLLDLGGKGGPGAHEAHLA